MKTIKLWLISSILLVMALSTVANAAKPFDYTSILSVDKLIIASDENATITLSLQDISGSSVLDAHPELNVTLNDNGAPALIKVSEFTQDGNTYYFTLQSTDSVNKQNVVITPHGNYNGEIWSFIENRELVEFKPTSIGGNANIDPTKSSIMAVPNMVTANGVSTSSITVILHDTEDRIVTNATIVPQQGAHDSTISSVINHNDGSYTFTVSSTTAEIVSYSAEATTPLGTATIGDANVTFTPILLGENTTVAASPLRVEANGIDTSLITMTLLDENDAPISNARVSLDADVNSSTISDVDDGRKDEGIYTFSVHSYTIGDVTYTASYFDQVLDDKKVTVTFWNKADASKGSVVADPTEVVNNNIDTSTITVTVLDALDKPVTDANVSLAGNPSTSSISSVDSTQSATGVYTFTVKSAEKGAVVYTATATVKDTDDNDVNVELDSTATVNFTNTTPDNMVITLSPSEQNTIVGTATSITASVKIANTNVVQVGVTVSLDGGDIGTSTATTCVTVADGTCTITVNDEKAETIVYVPKANGETPHAESNTASVTFTNPPTSSMVVTLSPSEQNITVGTDASIVATVLKQGTAIPLKDVTVSLDGGDIGTSTATTCVTIADGTCTMTVNDTKVETIVYVPQANGEAPHADSNTASVEFTTGTSIKVTAFTPESHTMQAGESVTISIQTQDTLGNPKDPSNLDDLIASQNDINISGCVKVSLGEHTCSVTSTVTGEYTLSTNVTGAPEQLSSTLTVTPSSGTFVTLTTDPEDTQEVGYDVTVAMTLKDDYDNFKDVDGAEVIITTDPSEANLTLTSHDTVGEYIYSLYDEKTETVTVETNVAGADEQQNASIVFTPGALDEEETISSPIVYNALNPKVTHKMYPSYIYPKDRFGNNIPLNVLENNDSLILECNTTRDSDTLDFSRSLIVIGEGIAKITLVKSTRKATIACQYKYNGDDIKESFSYEVGYRDFLFFNRIQEEGDFVFSPHADEKLVNANYGREIIVEFKVHDNASLHGDTDDINTYAGEAINILDNNISVLFVDNNNPDEINPVEQIGEIIKDPSRPNYFKVRVKILSGDNPEGRSLIGRIKIGDDIYNM